MRLRTHGECKKMAYSSVPFITQSYKSITPLKGKSPQLWFATVIVRAKQSPR